MKMNNTCQVVSHSSRSILTVCFAAQCKDKRVCCSLCQIEFHRDHIEQMVDFNFLLKFITTKSQEPNINSPKVMQVIQELNNVLKEIDDLTELIKEEIKRLSSANLQTFCKDRGNHYKIFTEQIGNQKWNELTQEILSKVESKNGEIIEKNFLVTYFGKSYSHFIKSFSQAMTQITQNLMFVDYIIDPNPFLKLKQMRKLQGHTDQILAIDICEQRSLLLSGSIDKTVKLWNLKDNQLLKTYKHTDWVFDVVFSSQGRYIAYGGQSNIINLIDIIDLKQNDNVTKLKCKSSSIFRLFFSNDQSYLIFGGSDETVSIWNVQTKVELFKLETGSSVFGVTMSRDNKFIVGHSQFTGIKIWDFKSEKLLCTHIGHPNGQGIILSNDEKQLISSGNDGKIKFWSLSELNQGKLLLIKEFQVANSKIQTELFTSDSRFIFWQCCKDNMVKVKDINTSEEVKSFELKNQIRIFPIYPYRGVAITKKMDMVAYADKNEIVVQRR